MVDLLSMFFHFHSSSDFIKLAEKRNSVYFLQLCEFKNVTEKQKQMIVIA